MTNSSDASSVAVRLRRAEAALREQLMPILREHDLGMEHWRIIAVVHHDPGLAMSSVATAAVVPAASLTRHVDKLVERGIVLRHIDAADRRRVVLALSSAGLVFAARLHAGEARAVPDLGEMMTAASVR